ncbi:MAG: hypothetical protein LC725_03155 [Lentisphaerae bacterium]|nr:hypothetical protein [Lentisphaerota bacterium]
MEDSPNIAIADEPLTIMLDGLSLVNYNVTYNDSILISTIFVPQHCVLRRIFMDFAVNMPDALLDRFLAPERFCLLRT